MVWNLVCNTFIEDFQKAAQENRIPDVTWDHFNVLACSSMGECYALDHPGHLGRPLARSEDREWIKKVSRPAWRLTGP